MKKAFSLGIVLGIFLLLGVIPSTDALASPKASTYIDKCQTLNKTGATYVLNNDVVLSTGNICFDIVASGVTLDLNGKSVSGNEKGYGVMIEGAMGSGEVVVKDGYIHDFNYGVFVDSSSNNDIINNTIYDNNFEGMELRSNLVTECSDNNVEDNHIHSNNAGVYLAYCSDNDFKNNVIEDNHASWGVFVHLSSDNVFERNIIGSNFYNGVILDLSDNNKFKDNEILDCSLDKTSSCIYISASDYNEFEGNKIDKSSNYGIWIQTFGNEASDNADHNVFRDTDMTDIASTAVFIDDDSNSENLNNSFINFTYNSESVDSRSQLFRKWYYRAYVEDSSGNPVSNAKVTVYDRNNALRHSLTSGSDGYTETVEIIDYYRTGSTKNHYSLYNIYVTKEGVEEELKKEYNVTSQQNNLKHVFTFGSSTDNPPKDKCEGADISKNGRVGSEDTRFLLKNYGRRNCTKINNWCNRADINKNGRVELNDLRILRKNLGKKNCS